MDNYELKMRIDEIEDLIKRRKFDKAVDIADKINWSKVKQTALLCNISDLYKACRRYDDAKLLLDMAYDMHPNRKDIVSALCDLCIRMDDIVGSTEYYKKYVQMDPNGINRYILLYKIYDMQGVPADEKIRVLEDLKKREPIANKGKWSYELAKLYEEVGLTTKCVEECDDLIMLVREGKYVKKAMELKMLHQQLTQSQEALYKSILIADTGRFPTELQTGPIPQKTEEPTSEVEAVAEPDTQSQSEASDDTVYTQEYQQEQEQAIPIDAEVAAPADELVKTVDVGQYSTINIQAALEESIKGTLNPGEVHEDEQTASEPVAEEGPDDNTIYMHIDNPAIPVTRQTEPGSITETIMAPMMQNTGEMEEIILPDSEEEKTESLTESESLENSEEPVEEITSPQQEEQDTVATEEEQSVSTPATGDTLVYEKEQIKKAESSKSETAAEKDTFKGIDMENVSKEELMRLIDMKVAAALENAMSKRVAPNTAPPKAIQGMLSEEYDGQIQMVIPEKKVVEKQITGQIELKDYLNDWESSKKRRQRSQEERIDRLVSQHTDNLLAAFDNETKGDALIQQLEKEALEKEEAAKKEKARLAQEEKARKARERLEQEKKEQELKAAAEAEEAAKAAAAVVEEELPDIEETFKAEAEAAKQVDITNTTEEITAAEVGKPETVSDKDDSEVNTSADDMMADESEDNTEESEEAKEKAAKEAQDIATAEAEAIDDDDEDDSTRAMTDEESALFSQFVQTKKGKKDLLKALDTISLASYVGNVCVTGETGEESVDLAKNVVQYAKTTDGNFSGKIGKVTGSSLNDKDIDLLVEKLSNGGLIIEKAGDMSEDTAAKLFKALNQENLGILVVLQDSRKAINKFLNYNDALRSMFNVRIEIEELSDDALVAYGRKYAERKEFAIDDMGILALHTRIDEMQTSDHIVTVSDVRDIVDEAISHATRFNPKHFTDIVFGKRYNEEDMIILKEKDFIR